MEKDEVLVKITTNFPALTIDKIRKIGEGSGNLAYEINTNLIFRFPKKPENQKQLEHEISIQSLLKKYSSLPVPEFVFIPQNHSFVGYKKLRGVPMLYRRKKLKGWKDFSQQIGSFLSKLHTIPSDELHVLDLPTENRSSEEWIKHGRFFFEKTKHIIPTQFLHSIEMFFNTQLPTSDQQRVFCHNDLGIEHILLTKDRVAGIIDWGGVALTNPACDFARIYRDLGETGLDNVLDKYTAIQVKKDKIRERAIFYGKCLLFEDLSYSKDQKLYLGKCLAAMEWMF